MTRLARDVKVKAIYVRYDDQTQTLGSRHRCTLTAGDIASAEQPAETTSENIEPPRKRVKLNRGPGSAGQPANESYRTQIIMKENTPLYTNFLEGLESMIEDTEKNEIMPCLKDVCFSIKSSM